MSTSSAGLAVLPVVSTFTPTGSGMGTTVAVKGTGLAGTTSVRFNGVAATISSVGTTSVKVRVLAGATTGPITVTTAGGTASSSAAFTVTP